VGEQALALLQSSSQQPSFTTMLMTLINELMGWDAEITFILEGVS
jgi:hypothetical protein